MKKGVVIKSNWYIGFIVFLLILPIAIPAHGGEAAKDQPTRLSLEKLFAKPPIYGRQPSGACWSPDGSIVAFYWNEKGGDILDIYLVPATGERPVNITNWKEEETPEGARFFGGGRLQWSPDSQRLLYVYKGDPSSSSPLQAEFPVSSPASKGAKPVPGGPLTERRWYLLRTATSLLWGWMKRSSFSSPLMRLTMCGTEARNIRPTGRRSPSPAITMRRFAAW